MRDVRDFRPVEFGGASARRDSLETERFAAELRVELEDLRSRITVLESLTPSARGYLTLSGGTITKSRLVGCSIASVATNMTVLFESPLRDARYVVTAMNMSGQTRFYTAANETDSQFDLGGRDDTGATVAFNSGTFDFGFVVLGDRDFG